jgi:hypothetical protein
MFNAHHSKTMCNTRHVRVKRQRARARLPVHDESVSGCEREMHTCESGAGLQEEDEGVYEGDADSEKEEEGKGDRSVLSRC